MQAIGYKVPVLLVWLLICSWQGTDAARAPIIILPGLFTSQLIGNYYAPVVPPLSTKPTAGTQQQSAPLAAQAVSTNTFNSTAASLSSGTTADGCQVNVSRVVVWPPHAELATTAPQCWQHLMSLQYKDNRFHNNTDTEVWAISAQSASNNKAKRSIYKLAGYEVLMQHIEQTLGYTRNRDLFILPHDFRLDLSTMESSQHLQHLSAFISEQVAKAGNQSAILIGHSSGALYGLKLLQHPALLQKVKGFIALAAPFGGTSAAIPARLSGSFDYLLPWLLQELQGILSSSTGTELEAAVRQYMYQISTGMPSVGMLMPYQEAFGAKMALITAGSGSSKRSYSVDQISHLLSDIGDSNLATAFRQTHTVTDLLTPLGGVSTYCIYGSSVDTPVSWRYAGPLKLGVVNDLPQVDVVGKGDGVVNLESLRLCGRVAGSAPGQVTELRGVTHFTVYQKRSALRAIQRALETLLPDL